MLEQIAQWIGGILGIATATALLVLTERAWKWFSAKLSQEQQAMLSDAAHKILVLGFTKVIPLIEREGWNSDAVRETVLDFGIDEMKRKFPDAVGYVEKFAGKIDASNPFGTSAGSQTAERLLRDVLQRALPAAATEAGLSPITPPAPVPVTDTAGAAAVAQGVAAAVLDEAARGLPAADRA